MARINYDENRKMLSRTDYDDRGRVAAYTEYDGESGRPVMAVDYTENDSPMVVTRYEYGSDGVLSRADTERYGLRAEIESRDVTVYGRDGNVESVTSYSVSHGENGTRTETAYDENGRAIEVIQYGVNNYLDGVIATTYEYDRNGNVSREETRSNILYRDGRIFSKEDYVGPKETTTYDRDDSGRITAENHEYHDHLNNYDYDTGKIVRWDRIEYEYGEKGGVVRQNFYENAADSSHIEVEYDENGNRTADRKYGGDGECIEKNIYNGDGSVRENERYSGGKIAYREEFAGRIQTSTVYDEKGEPEIKVEIDREEKSVVIFEYSYSYPDGKLEEVEESKFEDIDPGPSYYTRGEQGVYNIYDNCHLDNDFSYKIERRYDKDGAQTRSIKTDFSKEGKEIITFYNKNDSVYMRREFDLDSDDRITHAVDYEYDRSGEIKSVTEYGGKPRMLTPGIKISRTIYGGDGTAVRIEYDKDGKESARTEIEDDRADRGIGYEDGSGVDADAEVDRTDAELEGGDVDSDDGDSVD